MEKQKADELPQPVPEPLSGAETAELVALLYDIAGSRWGAMLVESNIVLTLAGARGQTEFYIDNPQPTDLETIATLNEILLPKGIQVHAVDEKGVSSNEDEDSLMVAVENLNGYERVTRLTRIPGVS